MTNTVNELPPEGHPYACAYFSNGMSHYATTDHGSGLYSHCCGAGLHRPANSTAGDPWFCEDCGSDYRDNKLDWGHVG